MKFIHLLLLLFTGLVTQGSFAQHVAKDFTVDFESFTLANGLRVIFHVDRSDPVVAVALTAHVGSAREKEGRTGFAHLFEHLLFLESENLGKGGLDRMSARIGGSGANGSTSRDRTNYFQTVPKDALEKMIWAEADKLGFFINTVTEPVLAKEKQVVKNEKRQRVDNSPYGHTNYVIDKNLYPEGHPYSWQVIGSLADLQNATLEDVRDFYHQWYVPNNVILTIAGDFEKDQAREWVHKYFDEIPSGADVARQEKQPARLKETKKRFYEDNFARLPELTIAWPGVHAFHEDSYSLEVLVRYLSEGKNAPLYKKLVEEKELTDAVRMYTYNSELAGQLMLKVRAYEGIDLDAVEGAIKETFREFVTQGIPEKDLKRIKAGQETEFYNSLSSVLGKGFQLAQYQIFADDPNYINKDVERMMAVTAAEVKSVFDTYIRDKNFVATSFVPREQEHLALEGSMAAEVVEEQIIASAEEAVDPDAEANYKRTPSSFDRSREPPYHGNLEVRVPPIWEQRLPSGMRVLGITNTEIPLVKFSLEIRGGLLLEDPRKPGVSNLLAAMLTRGTRQKTPTELEEAIALLGAQINVQAEEEKMILSGSTLARNFSQTMALLEEILLQPRWDEKEFHLVKQQTLSRIQQQNAEPNSIANREFKKLIYGRQHMLSHPIEGHAESVERITLEDLRAYYRENLTPLNSSFHVAGAMAQEVVLKAIRGLSAGWPPQQVSIPNFPDPEPPARSAIYFYDVPDAKQSVLRIGHPGPAATDEEFFPAQVMNYRLGGGGFASVLTQELRERKGYTYGIRSGFSGGREKGIFLISTGVRSNITFEAIGLIKQLLEQYGNKLDQEDLEVTRSFLIKSNARKFETLDAKLGMLSDISSYQLDHDFVKQREHLVETIHLLKIQDLARTLIDPQQMYFLVVGDARTQLERLEDLGLGKPVLLNPDQE